MLHHSAKRPWDPQKLLPLVRRCGHFPTNTLACPPATLARPPAFLPPQAHLLHRVLCQLPAPNVVACLRSLSG